MGGGVASKSQDTSATYENLRLFTEVLSIVQSQYVDEVPSKDVIYNAIKGTLRGLDPHSSFLDPEMYREMQVETRGASAGSASDHPPRRHPHRGGAHRGHVRIRAGSSRATAPLRSRISTKDMQLTDAVKRMRGKPGSKMVISVVREGWVEPKDFDIVREQIRVQSVKTQELENGIE